MMSVVDYQNWTDELTVVVTGDLLWIKLSKQVEEAAV